MADFFLDPAPPAAPPVPASDAERRALVALSLVPGVGAGRARALVADFGSAERVLAAPAGRLVRVDGVGRATAEAVRAGADARAVDDQFRRAERVGARLVAFGDDEYPALLREIYDPPPFLWVLGRFDAADDRAAAVVGTRRASDYGLRVAEAFARGLVEGGATVVSGLAYGVDVAAHRAALAAGGRTVAVLGSGVDRIYPSRHAPVVREVVERGAGAVVSELPMGAKPDAPHFPRRNRIVSGMSAATVVAEARATGGALLTAAIALEQNREVFAAPAPVFSDYEGTNRLVQQGWAALALGASDVLAALDAVAPAAAPTGAAPPAPAPPDLTAVERRLLDVLDGEPRPLDAVCGASGVDTSQALVYLLQLEFRGLVRQLAGKQFYRA
ncbi:DNA-processing protein DprA [Rubrivirga sp. S365]|uniref:DNA-processing protein DprA n=1 Tax=Rubrivirga sp. S365 TaxID=3076080 RepID=UPI0028CA0208|nr:DNA-processing protein DprA [Rubrivirga sp. S365]MDT7857117.1 DNA-processing protein DprA [Rubrivirga sp. S365]